MRKKQFMHTIGNDKKILLVTRPLCPPWDEASKAFAYTLARTATRYALTILTCRSVTPPTLPSRVSQFPLYTSSSLDLSLWQKMRLALFLNRKKHAFAIIHSFFTPTTQNARMMRLCLAGSGAALIQTVATLREDLYTDAEIKKILFGDMIVTYSAHAKKKLNALGFTNVRHIYPGIDLERYHPGTKSREILRQLGRTDNEFIVIYPGEYVRLGATDMLTDAFIDFFRGNPDTDIRFVFACRVKNPTDARKKEEVRRRFADAGLLQYVSFSDTIADMPALYNTADLVVFPVGDLNGKFDVPLIIIEAYACGKPVILSDLEQFAEFSNPDICVTIPKDSRTKIIESVAYIRENIQEQNRLGKNARAFVEKNFSITTSTESYEKIYAEL